MHRREDAHKRFAEEAQGAADACDLPPEVSEGLLVDADDGVVVHLPAGEAPESVGLACVHMHVHMQVHMHMHMHIQVHLPAGEAPESVGLA